ncbi:MAG TPA: PPC domain-containing protein [Chthoniobacteraceae bacterium]|nr:PPC domain-containing protein [Chthoniobacteraceae bacterium]
MKRCNTSLRARTVVLCGLWFASGVAALAQNEPRIGYAFPAGAQRGATVEVTVGGQFLDATQAALITGGGVNVTVGKYNRPLPQKRFNELRDYLEEARKKLAAASPAPPPEEMRRMAGPEWAAGTLKVSGATPDEIQAFLEMRKKRNDPKRQENAQLSESVTLKVAVAGDAASGVRELRLLTASGATNPVYFCIGDLNETTGAGETGRTADTAARVALPAVLNGWIPPGGVHHYAFTATHGMHLVIAVQARSLTPFLADAVPGWFQPAVSLQDAQGHEVAYADHFRFNPDPALCYDVPKDGVYLLEVRDTLYRGREDFVYRITAGQIPFVTDVFPLGATLGKPVAVALSGWNLTSTKMVVPSPPAEGVMPLAGFNGQYSATGISFATDALPEITAPDAPAARPLSVTPPVIVNGRIRAPGDVQVFSIACRAGEKIVAETYARRLNSPLDTWLKVTDAAGRQIAFNDDLAGKAAGTQTENVDSRVAFTAPVDGAYFIHLGDTQGQGGPGCAYRLRISEPEPDFTLFITPSCINARPGATLPVAVYAVRKDGFDGDIRLALKNAPPGFVLSGGWIPAGQDSVRATLTVPQGAASPAAPSPGPAPKASTPPSATPGTAAATGTAAAMAATAMPTATPIPPPPSKPVALVFEAQAITASGAITHLAIPADDREQAFAYHHFVPAQQFLAVTFGAGRGRAPIAVAGSSPMQLPAGGGAQSIVSVPGIAGRRVPFADVQPELQLDGAPDGITVAGFSPSPDGMVISFKAGTNVKTGLKGNLIIEAFVERTITPVDGKPPVKRRFSIGFLPAIPFEIVK